MSTPAAERARLLALIGSSWRTQAIHAMVQLRLADRLAGGPLPAAALADAVGANEEALRRLLRGLRLLGLVEACADGDRLTAMGRLLRTDRDDDSLAHWVRWWAGGVQWATWGQLGDAVREGAPMRGRCAPAAGYALHADCAPLAQVFHAAMAQLSAAVAPVLAERLAALGAATIVDVGGGRAELLVHILRACPRARGVLLEQEHALPAARDHLARADLLPRCALVAGDFFREVPVGAEVYVLKSVLHNWDDADGARVLAACRRAMPHHAVLAIVERIVADGAPEEAEVRSDLNMLVSLGGRERTLGELQQLLALCELQVAEHLRAGEHHILLCNAA